MSSKIFLLYLIVHFVPKGALHQEYEKKILAVIYFSLLTGIEEQRRKVTGFHRSVQLCLCIGVCGIFYDCEVLVKLPVSHFARHC